MGLIIVLVLVGLVISYVLSEEFMEIASKKKDIIIENIFGIVFCLG